MKKILVMLCATCVVICCCACGTTHKIEKYESDNVAESHAFAIILDEPLYELWYGDGKYQYIVYNQAGELIAKETLKQEPQIAGNAGGIVSVIWQVGTGASTRCGVFYDTKDSQRSNTIQYVLCYENGVVAYGDSSQNVIVKSLLDDSVIVTLTADMFLEAAEDVPDLYIDAQFSKSLDSLTVTYVSAQHTLLRQKFLL